VKLAFLVGLLAAASAATTATAGGVSPACDPRPHVDAFVQALAAGDLDAVDAAFATGPQWKWYSVADVAGQRLLAESMNRSTLRSYFARRIARHERLELLRFSDSGNGNFTFLLRRRADDLRGGRPVERQGKGWLNCSTGKISVWSLGGAPAPTSFGPCPHGALRLPAALEPARRAVVSFLRTTFGEMVPGLDLRDARVSAARPAPGHLESYTARVRCGLRIQRRTSLVRVTFPHVPATESLHSAAFYVSWLPGRWLVWRLIPLG